LIKLRWRQIAGSTERAVAVGDDRWRELLQR